MSGIPLHRLVVHFPIVLVTLLPISIAIALWIIRKGATPRRVWSVPVALAAALALSAWVATQTGESREGRVERVVTRGALHGHEEAAERFLVLSAVLVLVTAAGLAGGTVGGAARLVSAAGHSASWRLASRWDTAAARWSTARAPPTPTPVRTPLRPATCPRRKSDNH